VLTVSGEETRKPTGCRTGQLDQKTKEKAHRIRKMGACWNCWVQKVPVSLSPSIIGILRHTNNNPVFGRGTL
jgi:hypothetical protein